MTESIGYKRPPTHTRFRPGQSGNPSGRPKKRLEFRDALLAELAEKAPDGGGKRGATKLQALVKALVDAAIGGNPRAQSILLSTMARLGPGNEPDGGALSPDDRAILDGYVEEQVGRLAVTSVEPVEVDKDQED